MNDRASLENLNDIVIPGAVAWWPLAPGWFVLAAAVMVLLVFITYRYWRKRQANRYRVLALQELSDIRRTADTAGLLQLPALLKRTALSVWPRSQVAALNGKDWHRFLDRTAATSLFTSRAGDILDRLAYGSENGVTVPDQDVETVMAAAMYWLKKHRTQ